MKRVNYPNLYLVSGSPNQGKTSFTMALVALAESHWICYENPPVYDPDVAVIMSDRTYYCFIGEDPYTTNVAVTDHIHRDAGFDKQGFLKMLYQRLEIAFSLNPRDIVLEGYAMNFVIAEVAEYVKDRATFIHVRMRDNAVHVDERVWHTKTAEKILNAYAPSTVTAYREAIIAARAYVTDREKTEILKKSTYQSFPDLGQSVANSNSMAKFQALKLPSVKNANVLDVGCNAGFMSIQMRKLGAAHVTGIDTLSDFLKTASRITNTLYHLNGVSFYEEDFFKFSRSGYDLILATSVFHYFKERQQEFLDKAFEMLLPGGTLVLEVGLSQENINVPHVQKYSRSVDPDPCHFPNLVAFMNMARKFTLQYYGQSVSQPGDPIPRFVVHLRKE